MACSKATDLTCEDDGGTTIIISDSEGYDVKFVNNPKLLPSIPPSWIASPRLCTEHHSLLPHTSKLSIYKRGEKEERPFLVKYFLSRSITVFGDLTLF